MNRVGQPVPEYQHVVVVMSIVLGLAVTQLLKGIAQLYRTRSRVQTYWIHSGWSAGLPTSFVPSSSS